MSNYTDQEVQDAVEKIIRSTVRHPTGILGDRNINVSFSDIQEAAAGCFILYFNAPFYVLFLGAKRLLDLVQTQVSTLDSLIDAVLATDRHVTPIDDISPLANAKAALEELEAAVSQRTDGFDDIQDVPAYRRYAQNLDLFISQTGANVKGPVASSAGPSSSSAGSVIVDTPAGARGKIPGLVRQVTATEQELIRRVGLLASAIDDFSSLNLPRVAAQGVISRAREVLDQHFTDLSSLSPVDRLENLRAVMLDLLTQKPLVKKFGAASGPSEYIDTEGFARAYATTSIPGTAALVKADKPGPYPLLAPNLSIQLAMNGGAPFDFPLPSSFVAELTGTLTEPFVIDSTNDQLRIVFGDLDTTNPIYDIALTQGTRTAAQVALEVNAAIAGTGLVMEERFYPLRYEGLVAITSLGGNNARFTVIVGNLISLGVKVGDEVFITEGPDAGTSWDITAVDLGGQFVDTTGGAPVTPGTYTIQIGPPARALALVDTDEVFSVYWRRSIKLPADSPKVLTAATLGFYPGAVARSRPVAAEDLATYINTSTSAFAAGTTEEMIYSGSARSEPTDATIVVFTKQIALADYNGAQTLIFSIDDSVEVGDIVYVRSSPELNDIGVKGEVLAVDSMQLTVDFEEAVTAGIIEVEIGPSFDYGFGDIVFIEDGPNTGLYRVSENQGVRGAYLFSVPLDRALPAPKMGDQPVTFTAILGQEYLVFMSNDKTKSSDVSINNTPGSTGAEYFFETSPIPLPRVAVGTTTWLQFDTFPSGVQVGDHVLFYMGAYNVPSSELTVQAINSDERLIQLNLDVADLFELSFDSDVPPPFGRIRIAQMANYAELKSGADSWLEQPPQQELYFRDLARFLNPIVTNSNPTPVMINDATNQLKEMLTSLQVLQTTLDEYESPVVEPVDVMLSTFRQKGADRAIDLLLEGQFTTFFNLGVDGMSYSGELMKNLRELAREDLPVRKFNRKGAGGQKLIGQAPDQTDFEFSAEDADTPDQPDIPMAPDVSSPGENI